VAEAVLSVRQVARYFGGLAAVDGVSLDLLPGRIHAVIGPNGAGKTTLVNLLSGELKPSGGSVMFKGVEIAGLPPPRIAGLGIARSYQRVNIFADFTASENCRLAAQALMSTPWRQLMPAAGEADLIATGERALDLVGLAEQRTRIAGTLSHGEQRQLELAMTLATDPEVLLLDEPLAGLGTEESARMAALIKTVADGRAVLLIEHDMDAVFSIADDLTVMVEGKVLASGVPEAIRRDPAVRSAYLGEAVLP
jgi:branched-chain amino acid transport system ATP-binding protein